MSVFLCLLGELVALPNFIETINHETPLIFGSSNTDEGTRWSELLPFPANSSAPNLTEFRFNFLHGQFYGLMRQSVNQAIEELYPLEVYNNSPSLQRQQMYGEARFMCTAAMLTGNLSPYQKTYQYRKSLEKK